MQTMLGSGIYTLREAARYALISPRLMNRWFFGDSKGRRVLSPQFHSGEKLLSFLDFVQTLAIREIRIQHKIPLNKFRQAIRIARRDLGVDYPFARQHYTYLWHDSLVIKLNPDEFIQASGVPGQRLFPFVELYLKKLEFDAGGLARAYHIYRFNDVTIDMSPGLRFGEPLLPSGYSAMAIWDAIQSEGGIEPAADAYGIPKDEVEAAYRFNVDYLEKPAA